MLPRILFLVYAIHLSTYCSVASLPKVRYYSHNMIREDIKKIVQKAINKVLVGHAAKIEFQLDHAQDKKFGDFTTNVAMKMARELKKSPIQIGQQICEEILKDKSAQKFISKVEVMPPGFINFFVAPELLIKELVTINKLGQKYGLLKIGAGKKMVVEHTSVNPNKAMHVGHLRNMAIGDSVAGIMRAVGYKVEVENYIDDTGVQVADVVVAMRHFKETPREGQKFDHFCWDVYSRIQKEYETNATLKDERVKVQHELESGRGELAAQAEDLVKRIIKDHLVTAGALGVFYDAFIFESSILRSGLWNKTFDELKKSGKVVFETAGPNEGCWVFKNLALSPDEKLKNPDKILVTSKGVAVYTAKDIAYHLWKFGKGKGDFKYAKIAVQKNGSVLWASGPKGVARKFGHSDAVVNVIDVRQAYPQMVVKSALKELGFQAESENLKHLSYEVVSLSPSTAEQLGVSVEEGKGSYAMSGRKGIGVKADDLLKALVAKIDEKRKGVSDGVATHEVDAQAIAAAAIKAYMLKQSLNQEVVFDLEQALSLTGDSGPYLQYTHARIKGILGKAGRLASASLKSEHLAQPEEQDLLRQLYIFEEIIEQAALNLMPHLIYHYLLGLSQAFNTFYAKHQVLKAEDAKVRAARLQLVKAVAQVIKNGLQLLGIQAPERM